MDVSIGENKPIDLTCRGHRTILRPAFRPSQQISPAGRRVAHDAWVVLLKIRKNILFRTSVRGIVPQHEDIQNSLSRKLPKEKNINIISAKLPQPFFQCAAEVRIADDEVVGSSCKDVSVPI